MLIDTHLHVGQFYDLYFTPREIIDFMDSCGVNYCLISSTTTCEGDYPKVIMEIRDLIRKGGNRILACLWLTESVINERQIDYLINCGINWKCLKIHPAFEKTGWHPEKESIKYLFDIANRYQLPILIHTGYDQDCNSLKYDKIIKSNPYVRVILAHGRPIVEAHSMALRYDNVYIDTAFMPLEDILFLINNGLQEKILWGSDYPIVSYFYKHRNPCREYIKKLKTLKNNVNPETFQKLTYLNAKKLFMPD